jgi:hypothetical protein
LWLLEESTSVFCGFRVGSALSLLSPKTSELVAKKSFEIVGVSFCVGFAVGFGVGVLAGFVVGAGVLVGAFVGTGVSVGANVGVGVGRIVFTVRKALD